MIKPSLPQTVWRVHERCRTTKVWLPPLARPVPAVESWGEQATVKGFAWSVLVPAPAGKDAPAIAEATASDGVQTWEAHDVHPRVALATALAEALAATQPEQTTWLGEHVERVERVAR